VTKAELVERVAKVLFFKAGKDLRLLVDKNDLEIS
jgi:hypothetical protein